MTIKQLFTAAAVVTGIAMSVLATGPATHAATQNCVDGSSWHNISATISNHDTVTVHTKNNAPLCKDLTLYWSSYSMPDNYNGKGFTGNATATPQSIYDNAVLAMKAGDTTATATIKLPECKNVQTDLYYGPEITTVTPAGHAGQWITGEVNGFPPSYSGNKAKDLSACQTPTTPVTPTTPTTPSTPSTPVTPSTPALPSTGTSTNLTVALTAVLAAVAYGVTYLVNRTRALNA